MVSVLDSRSSGPGSSPGREHCVVFLDKTLYPYSASYSLTWFMLYSWFERDTVSSSICQDKDSSKIFQLLSDAMTRMIFLYLDMKGGS